MVQGARGKEVGTGSAVSAVLCRMEWVHRVSSLWPRTATQSAYRDTQTLVKHALGLFDLRTFDDTKESLQRHLDAMIL